MIPEQLRRPVFVATTLVIAVVAARLCDHATVAGLDALGFAGQSLKEPIGVRIEIADPTRFSAIGHLGLLICSVVLALVLRPFIRDTPVGPLVGLLVALVVLCVGWDAIVRFPITQLGRLVEQANDALTLIMCLSLVMAAFVPAPSLSAVCRFAGAALLSFAAKLLAVAAILLMADGFNGATLVLLMFSAYTFLAFFLHMAALAFALCPRAVADRSSHRGSSAAHS